MRIRITEGPCAADTMFRACLAATEFAGRIVDIDMTDTSPPSPGPRSIEITALVALQGGRMVGIMANCHIVRTEAGWTDGLCDFYGQPANPMLVRFLYDMAQPNPEPVVYKATSSR